MPSDPEEDYIPWIQQFCELFGHDYFVQVSQDFIEDDFNLTDCLCKYLIIEKHYTQYWITKLKRQKIITLTIQPPIPAITMIHGMVQVTKCIRIAKQSVIGTFCRIIIWFNPCQIHSLQTRSNCHGIQV